MHVQEECAACGHRSLHSLDEWESVKETAFVPALESISGDPSDEELARSALEATSKYGEGEEFEPLAELIESHLSGDAEISTLSQLARCHERFARFEEAERLYRRVLTLEERPEAREALREMEARPRQDPPLTPGRFRESFRFLLLPLLALARLTWLFIEALRPSEAEVYLVNGLKRAYEVEINGQRMALESPRNPTFVPRRGDGLGEAGFLGFGSRALGADSFRTAAGCRAGEENGRHQSRSAGGHFLGRTRLS